jgi:predicted nuclease of restriction endonuclease-like (RecB) superfamily
MASKKSLIDKNYSRFVRELKGRNQSAQIKAAVSVNSELILLYWDMGKRIEEMQKSAAWGDGFLQQLSEDLQKAFPDMKGFSYRNLRWIKQWYQFWSGDLIWQQAVAKLENNPNTKQLVAQLAKIPWGHNLVILSKAQNHAEALFYVQKTIENNWSRAVLIHQVESRLYQRKGRALTNFKKRLPRPQSDLAQEIMKDPYNFDFLALRKKYDERELEDALTGQMTKFLLELGAGFSFIGKQYKITVENEDFFIDLLFYHARLHCYVVVELKTVNFKPEFTGKLNFYISAIDEMLKTPQDNPTIGMIVCKSKNRTVVEYSLRDIAKPIGVSGYELTKVLPDTFKSSLPSIKDIEAELEGNHVNE